MSSSDESRLFPEAECVAAIGELSAWTSVQTVLAAARYIEDRAIPQDALDPSLAIPNGDSEEVFSDILLLVMRWLIQGYRVPEPKIALARSLDSEMSEAAAKKLAALRFKPDIVSASPGKITAIRSASGIETNLPPNSSLLVVRDDPAVIEMVQAPLICMISMLRRSYDLAKKMRSMQKEEETKRAKKFTVYHQPYADSRLSAILEAVCFYCWGLDLGLIWGDENHSRFDVSYRAVNIQGTPPIDIQLLKGARDATVKMLGSLS